MGAFRQNVIRVIGNYGKENEADEYDDEIKVLQDEMVKLIEENAKIGSYNEEFDSKYKKIAEQIDKRKQEQIEAKRKKKLAENYDQRIKDMDAYIQNNTHEIKEFDNDLVRRLVSNIKVASGDKILIQFQSGIVMEEDMEKI